MTDRDRLDPRAALAEIERVDRQVHAAGRWQAWIWLILAIATPAFFIVTWVATDGLRMATALGFVLLGLALWAWDARARKRVVERDLARADERATWLYVGLVVVTVALLLTVIPEGMSIWLVIAAILPTLPAIYVAWRAFRR